MGGAPSVDGSPHGHSSSGASTAQRPHRRRRSGGGGKLSSAVSHEFKAFLAGAPSSSASAEGRAPRQDPAKPHRRSWRDADPVMKEGILVWGDMELSSDVDERERRAAARKQRRDGRKEARQLLAELASSSFDRRPASKSSPATPVPTQAAAARAGMGLASLGSPGQPQRSRSSGYLDPVKWRQEHCKKTHKKFAKEEPRGVHNTNVLRDGVTILRTIDPRLAQVRCGLAKANEEPGWEFSGWRNKRRKIT
jgi:hypothetical protein